MLQGVGAVGECWRPQINVLLNYYSLIVVDNRGIGRSTLGKHPLSVEQMADDALRIAEVEGAQSFHLVGHSLGGLIAQEIALRAPNRVRSLALLCTFYRGLQGSSLKRGMICLAIRTQIGTLKQRRNAFLELVMPKQYLEAQNRESLAATMAELFGRDLGSPPQIVREQLHAMAQYDRSVELRSLDSIPTLVLSGEYDRIALPSYGRELAHAIPNSKYIELTGAGHALTIQCPEVVNAILKEFWEQS